MRLRWISAALCSVAACFAQLEPLERPLRLPPGNVQILAINKAGSYFGDAVRMVDCPENKDNPFGTCGNVLFGGFAMFASPISGMVEVRFYPIPGNKAYFEVSHPGNLKGDDVPLKAPQFYEFRTQQNFVFDAFDTVSSGLLDLVTGEVTNFTMALNFFNSFYEAFGKANPRLRLGAFRFPGAYGSGHMRFEQRSDGLLDLTYHGSTFLPLGNQIDGLQPRMPLPFCGAEAQCGSFPAPGTSFRPSIHYTTKALPADRTQECAPNCPDFPPNSIQQFTTHTYYTYFLEGFTMNVPQLGGPAQGRTHWTGRIEVQFGERTGDLMPVFFSLLAPAGIIGEPPKLDTTLPELIGVTVGFIGHDIVLRFPNLNYFPIDMALASDPFDGWRGLLNVKTGKFVDDLLFSGFLTHNVLLRVIEQNDGRIAPVPFLIRGPGSFERGVNNETLFRFQGAGYRNYEGFLFPSPDLQKSGAWVAGPGSRLDPQLRIQAGRPGDNPVVTKSGTFTNVVDGIGDTVTFSYNVPCDARGKTGTFEYTNTSSNPRRSGSFKMDALVNVTCTNSRDSRAAPGDYDTITFAGFGTWSKDPDEKDPHVATVQIYFNVPGGGTYFSVLIDGGQESNADMKPAAPPVP